MARPEHRSLYLVASIIAAALIGLPWTVGGRSAVGQAYLVLLVVLAGGVVLLRRDAHPLVPPSPQLALCAILVGASALQTIYPDRTVQALLLLLAYLVAGALAMHVARAAPPMERALLGAGALSSIVVVVVGLVWLSRGNEGGFYANALIGPFGYPNALAGYLLLAAGAAAGMLQPDRSRTERGIALAACAACVLGLYFTRSRGAWVAVLVGALCWSAIQWRRQPPSRRLWIALGALALLLGLGVIGTRAATLLSFVWSADTDGPADTSIQWRLAILRWTWAMIVDHPWLGVGPGAFPVALIHYQQLPYVSGENPHNLYAEVAAEYGLPAGLLASLGLWIWLARAARAVREVPLEDPVRERRAALLAALVSSAVHSGMDLDWSFPAVALLGAVILGLVAASMPTRHPAKPGRGRLWRVTLVIVLAVAAVAALTRYYSAALVSLGRDALTAGSPASAERYLTQARYLNPASASALYWLAWAARQAGDLPGAIEAAERGLRVAPEDPNTHALAGEMTMAAGRWEPALSHFRRAVDRAPAAHLRYHAGLLEAAMAGGKTAEALHAYARAISVFTEQRVLSSEARCLAPGDRYLLAHMSRLVAGITLPEGDSALRSEAADRAGRLSEPDPRGICSAAGRAGQTSPEAAVASYWHALGQNGWPDAQRYLLPERRHQDGNAPLQDPQEARSTPRVLVVSIYSLSGGARRATVVYQVESGDPARPGSLCVRTGAQFTPEGWFLDDIPSSKSGPCHLAR